MHIKKHKEIKSLLALAIITAYVLAFIPLAHHHDFENKLHNEISCEEKDTDACHNFIYHGAKTPKCLNHSHASSAKTQCLSCHSFIPAKKAIVFYTGFTHVIDVACCNFFSIAHPFSENSDAYFYLRGPPIV